MKKINYKLAQKLKDAGLGQNIDAGIHKVYKTGEIIYGWREPTLEELADACGEKIRGFTKDGDHLMGGEKTWGAWAVITHSGGVFDTEMTIWGYGRVPIVAVANLYLALHDKKN